MMQPTYAYWRLFPLQRAAVNPPEAWGNAEKHPLIDPGWVEDWAAPTMTLPPYPGHDWLDHMSPTRLPCLCTPRLRDLIDGLRGEDDAIQWLPVEVVDAHGDRREYWMLRLPVLLVDEIIDPDRTVYSTTGIMKAVLDGRKAAGRHIFRYPYAEVSTPVVSDALRSAIVDAGFTGCQFDPVPATHVSDADGG